MQFPTQAEIFDLAQQAPSRSAFRREVALRLQRAIGADTALFHDIAPRTLDMSTVLGLDEHFLGRARDEHSGPYTDGLLVALQGGQAVVDAALFGTERLRKLRFYNEVSKPAGIAQLMYTLVAFRDGPPAFVALGRAPGSTPFAASTCENLGRLTQTLTLADAALAGRESHADGGARFELTKGQQELVAYVRMGLTNQLIASALGISPNTVRNRLAELFRRCGASNRAELVHLTAGKKAALIESVDGLPPPGQPEDRKH